MLLLRHFAPSSFAFLNQHRPSRLLVLQHLGPHPLRGSVGQRSVDGEGWRGQRRRSSDAPAFAVTIVGWRGQMPCMLSRCRCRLLLLSLPLLQLLLLELELPLLLVLLLLCLGLLLHLDLHPLQLGQLALNDLELLELVVDTPLVAVRRRTEVIAVVHTVAVGGLQLATHGVRGEWVGILPVLAVHLQRGHEGIRCVRLLFHTHVFLQALQELVGRPTTRTGRRVSIRIATGAVHPLPGDLDGPGLVVLLGDPVGHGLILPLQYHVLAGLR